MITTDFWRDKSVFITGHTGFKGSWLSLWLDQLGANVYGFALAPDSDQSLFSEIKSGLSCRFRNTTGDIREFDALRAAVNEANPDVVFHLAAQPLVRRSYENPLETWSTNVSGSLHLLESLRSLTKTCSVVMVTTDKVYANKEWLHGYRETDRLGGNDPYSASKAAMEIAVDSWRASFCGLGQYQNRNIRIATARAGNVIGGGDWARDRIFPDAIRALSKNMPISVRNPLSTRPWQHVLEPLGGYLRLAVALFSEDSPPCESFNFGPNLMSNRTVEDLISTILELWPGTWVDQSNSRAPHEAQRLHLQIDKVHHQLGWSPLWDYTTTVSRTVDWYLRHNDGVSALECCLADLQSYRSAIENCNQI